MRFGKGGSFKLPALLRRVFRASQHKPAPVNAEPNIPRKDQPRALIATNQLEDFSGSEIIALEMTRYLIDAGYRVDAFANRDTSLFRELFLSNFGITIQTDPKDVRPFHYDFVYFQHQAAPLFCYDRHPDDAARTTIVFGRLARRTFLECGGWAHDNALGDITIANSELTAERLIETGVSHPIHTFYNAAPSSFFAPARERPQHPQKIIAITNHADPALLDAIARLRTVARVTHYGRLGEKFRRITPEIVHGADLVISIGKSVPYALVARTPVYVYDHFGGPGYLNAENFPTAARYNFTGRCCERKITGDEIFTEIWNGYREASDFAAAVDPNLLERYRFEAHMDQVRALVPTDTSHKRDRLSASAPAIRLERMLAQHIRSSP